MCTIVLRKPAAGMRTAIIIPKILLYFFCFPRINRCPMSVVTNYAINRGKEKPCQSSDMFLPDNRSFFYFYTWFFRRITGKNLHIPSL